MTYKAVIEAILNIAKEIGAGTVGAFDLNTVNQMPDVEYPLFYITTQNIEKNLDILRVEMQIVYGELLYNDQSNYLDVQSRGIEFLSKVINVFRDRYDAEIGDYTFQIFVQSFADVLTGCISNIVVEVAGEGSC